MKNISKILALTIAIFTHVSLQGVVIYRQAKLYDLPKILELLAHIAESPEDSSKLVVFPEFAREDMFKEAISRSRLFVVVEDGQIISFLKLYLIESARELEDLMISELRCIDSQEHTAQLESLSVTTSQIDDPTFDQTTPMESIGSASISFQTLFPTYIYYGGAYTRPDRRGQRHGSLLLRTAFSLCREKIVRHIMTNKSKQLILAYGQVIANQNNTLMRREFVKEIPQILSNLAQPASRTIQLHHCVYLSCMPAFEEHCDGKTFSLLPDEESRAGRGNLIIYTIPPRDLSVSQ